LSLNWPNYKRDTEGTPAPKYRGAAQVEFQLSTRYVAVVDFEAYFSGNGTEVEIYCQCDMVDLDNETTFDLASVLPHLRYELELETEKQTKQYIEEHYEELTQDLLDDEQLAQLDANVAYAERGRVED
jgi:hypothetical protein